MTFSTVDALSFRTSPTTATWGCVPALYVKARALTTLTWPPGVAVGATVGMRVIVGAGVRVGVRVADGVTPGRNVAVVVGVKVLVGEGVRVGELVVVAE